MSRKDRRCQSYEGVVRLTRRRVGEGAPRPEACVFSPCGRHVAYVRRVRQATTPSGEGAAAAPATKAKKLAWLRKVTKKLSSVFSKSESSEGGAVGDGEGDQEEKDEEEGEWFNQVCVVSLKWGGSSGPFSPVKMPSRAARIGTGKASAYDRHRIAAADDEGLAQLKHAAMLAIGIAAVARGVAVIGHNEALEWARENGCKF